jgi:putative ABC transport system permease protein
VRRAAFRLRWSWRDLRSRWLLVAAIAVVIAIGTGLYSGLGSLENWRKDSNDASFAALNAHDLEIELAEGSFARPGELRSLVESIPDSAAITRAEERLIVPTQVEIGRRGAAPLLASAELVGTGLREADPVDGYAADAGRNLGRGDEGRPTALLEALFGRYHELPDSGSLRVTGGERLRYVGLGTSPEYFLVTRPGGGDFGGSEASFAVVFTSLRTVQRLTGSPLVNDLALRLLPGSDPGAVREQLELAVKARGLGADVTELEDEPAHRVLYRDAEGDQQLFNIFAMLILAGAALRPSTSPPGSSRHSAARSASAWRSGRRLASSRSARCCSAWRSRLPAPSSGCCSAGDGRCLPGGARGPAAAAGDAHSIRARGVSAWRDPGVPAPAGCNGDPNLARAARNAG